jgi:hypothetical protein
MDAGNGPANAHQKLPIDPQQSLRSFGRGRLIEDNARMLNLFEAEARNITVPTIT